jgi:hypothetical protein
VEVNVTQKRRDEEMNIYDVYEILVTVGLTVAAGAVIAFVTLKLQSKHSERGLRSALRGEIERNRGMMENFANEWVLYWGKGIKNYPEAPILFVEAYQALRLSGEVLKLSVDTRSRLNNTMRMIDIHNFRVNEEGLDYGKAKGNDPELKNRMDRIIENLKSLETELGEKVQKPEEEIGNEEGMLRRYIISKVPAFFFFGLFSIYADYLLRRGGSEDVPIFFERLQRAVSPVLLPFGITSIALAIILCIVGLNYKIPKKLKGVREKIKGFIMGRIGEAIYWVVSITVFGLSFFTLWASLASTDISAIVMIIIFSIGIVLTLVLFVDNMISARQGRVPKDE